MGCQELQELVLHVGQVERFAVDGRLVCLQVQGQRSVLDQLRTGTPPGSVEEVLDPCLEFGGPDRRQAEVVEQVVTQLQVGQLAASDQQQEWRQRRLHLPEPTAQGERSLRVGVGNHDGAGPSLVGFVGHCGIRVGDGLPRPAVQIEALGQFRWRWVWVDEEGVHGVGGVSAPPVCPVGHEDFPVSRVVPAGGHRPPTSWAGRSRARTALPAAGTRSIPPACSGGTTRRCGRRGRPAPASTPPSRPGPR